MHPACAPSAPRPAPRPAVELADIVRLHAEALRQRRALTPEQHATLRAIERCRTAALGGHLDVCTRCGHERPSYNSCRNRHCPKCQALAQARWVEERSARLLPVPYFHVVFTLPAELRVVAKLNRRVVFDAMFAAAGATLVQTRRRSEAPRGPARRHRRAAHLAARARVSSAHQARGQGGPSEPKRLHDGGHGSGGRGPTGDGAEPRGRRYPTRSTSRTNSGRRSA
jgi:hypothetical protein